MYMITTLSPQNHVASYNFNYIHQRLSHQELDVAVHDSAMNSFDDLLILALMKDLTPEEFKLRGDLACKPEFMRDFQRFSVHWTEQAKWYAGIDLHAVHGKPADYTDVELHVGLKMDTEGRRARVFYSLKYPERMEPLQNPDTLESSSRYMTLAKRLS